MNNNLYTCENVFTVVSNGEDKFIIHSIIHVFPTALLSVGNDIHLNFAKGESTALLLLDLSAAFDTIDHNILLHQLSSCFGLGGIVIKWLTSYLTDRSQTVKIGDSLFEKKIT